MGLEQSRSSGYLRVCPLPVTEALQYALQIALQSVGFNFFYKRGAYHHAFVY
jgi:hypothetical protein